MLFHKRLCGPLANSRFHHQPDPASRPNSKLEAAYHKADKASRASFNCYKQPDVPAIVAVVLFMNEDLRI